MRSAEVAILLTAPSKDKDVMGRTAATADGGVRVDWGELVVERMTLIVINKTDFIYKHMLRIERECERKGRECDRHTMCECEESKT